MTQCLINCLPESSQVRLFLKKSYHYPSTGGNKAQTVTLPGRTQEEQSHIWWKWEPHRPAEKSQIASKVIGKVGASLGNILTNNTIHKKVH